MTKSAYVLRLDAIQSAANELLRGHGFRKSGRSHNRTTDKGLIHVVNFQMGEFPIGDYVIPGIRESSYGTFAVNLGVLLPCIYRLYPFPMPKTVRDGHCSIRSRILNPNGNESFSLEVGKSPDPSDILTSLRVQAFPFFDQFEAYKDVIAYYRRHNVLPSQNHGRASLEAAVILHELGDTKNASHVFDEAYDSDHKGFKEYVSEVAARFGYVVS